ncbi:hypothetical protein [Thermococcus piezophilus]|uniref:HEAT repeat domain-containing protein n=1 Tax=Thermococcus piezophilus TaxID=1712654 RepID=A0A172WH01_9EURY|nr:hypothetical protein [Thermococcus piezophilus]ANF22724.1 hypothetical protein A7C91_05720 [Thermococcus piezophilus]
MGGVSTDKIMELILSWQMMDAVELSRGSEEALLALIDLAREEDRTIKMRALAALEEVLNGTDRKTKSLILKSGFDAIVEALHEGDERLNMRALRVLKRLVGETPLREKQLVDLVDALASLVSRGEGLAWLEAVELAAKISVPSPPDGVLSRMASLLNSPNLHGKALALRLLLNMGQPSSENWGLILRGTAELIRSGNPLLVEVALDALADILKLPSTIPMEGVLREILPVLKELTKTADNLVLRARAGEILGLLEGALYSYYRSRPEEARNVVKKFLNAGLIDEAMILALVVGDSSLLLGVDGEMQPPDVLGGTFDKLPGSPRGP